MVKFVLDLFKIEKKPLKGLLPIEWAAAAYMLFTFVLIMFFYTKMTAPEAMIYGRLRIIAMTAALWLVYRIFPCKFTRLARVSAQLGLLAWWYPDTYEFNRLLPNLDYVFAQWEQNIFGCQPALLFSKELPDAFFSELFDMGYAAYYPMIALTVFYYFIWRYKEFERVSFILLASFFIYYVVFIFVPVAGPTFYYKAVGLKTITAGVFPNIHDYFNLHKDCLPSPGFTNGFFYNLVEDAKAAGERPTAAFPSSHVGISTICMFLVWHTRNYKLLMVLAPFYFFLCCATVYIQAHYLIDAIAGVISAILVYLTLFYFSKRMVKKGR
ncbi:MAG: phosphatase PAP2 family protein [Prevotella pallens]|nr:phosphatase PAP2 family protein [Prevotella pallens]